MDLERSIFKKKRARFVRRLQCDVYPFTMYLTKEQYLWILKMCTGKCGGKRKYFSEYVRDLVGREMKKFQEFSL